MDTNSTTARLDNTYYSILSKFSTLQHTILGLQDLCTTARELNNSFIHGSENLTHEISDQLAELSDYSQQEARIKELHARIVAGKKKVEKLSERVDVVRQRTTTWSRVEASWEEKTRRRIKLFWALSAVVLVLVVGGMIWQYTPTRQGGVEERQVPLGKEGVKEVVAQLVNESLERRGEEKRILDELREGRELEEDERLKIFDEL